MPKIFHIIVVLYGECIPYADHAVPDAYRQAACVHRRESQTVGKPTEGRQGPAALQSGHVPTFYLKRSRVRVFIKIRETGKTINLSDRMGSMSAVGECKLTIPVGIRKKKAVNYRAQRDLGIYLFPKMTSELKAYSTLELRLPISEASGLSTILQH